MLFSAPIPGQSLTEEPKKYPWTRQVQINDPGEALEYHIERMSDPKVQKGFLKAIEGGVPISILTKMAVTGGVAQGMHDIDTSLIITPVLQEYLVNLADATGMEYREFFEEDEGMSEEEAMSIAVEDLDTVIEAEDIEGEAEEYLEDTIESAEEEKPMESRGLGAKRGMK